MSDCQHVSAIVPVEQAGKRLDKILALLFADFSRSRLQQWLKSGQVLVDGERLLAKRRLRGGEKIELTIELVDEVECQPEPIPLDLIYQDESLIVVNKPAGLVVHPAAGNWQGTLQNGLLHLDPTLAQVPRAGIVHRLDKETSGLLVIARTLQAHKSLVDQLQARSIKREYRAIVQGVMIAGGRVDEPIGRHPANRLKMAVVASGKPAVTYYKIKERFRTHSYLQVNLETGRTHQIRVHMAHIRHPLLGDPVYAGRLRMPKGLTEAAREQLQHFRRQALHARTLGLEHPESGQFIEWSAPLPDDMQQMLETLRQDAAV
ncbi:MAG: 23S rRNA pseudouridine(1911/1915/1917) synthase RluD [Candidatus Polarisedimenticolaceae bacterium]|nr:23S rRNA pseudouridine(1911/1915/1917) synthase RluD [Candidatus Polarisedimenticolaceae bacterium]